MVRRRQIYEGKAKILYEGPEPGTLIQYFKDDATAFNAQKRGTISGKGVLNNRISELIFSMLYNPWRAIIQLTGSLIILAFVGLLLWGHARRRAGWGDKRGQAFDQQVSSCNRPSASDERDRRRSTALASSPPLPAPHRARSVLAPAMRGLYPRGRHSPPASPSTAPFVAIAIVHMPCRMIPGSPAIFAMFSSWWMGFESPDASA